MAHRIVKETYKSGKTRYVVQTNDGWFGLKKKLDIWSTEKYHIFFERYDAIFGSLEDAKTFCSDMYFNYDDLDKNSEVIATYGEIDN